MKSASVPVTDQSQKPSDLQSCLDGKPRSAKKGLDPKYTLLKMKNKMKTNQDNWISCWNNALLQHIQTQQIIMTHHALKVTGMHYELMWNTPIEFKSK